MPTVIPSDGFRYYGKLYNTNHGAPAFQYIYDSGVVWQNDAGQLITGAERPVVPTDLAANINLSGISLSVGAVNLTGVNVVTLTGNTPVSLVNTAPIPVSGVVVSSPSPIQAISGYVNTIVTGAVSASFDTTPLVLATASGNNNTLVADRLLSGISGQLGNTLNVSVTNTAPLPISGVVQASVSIGNVAVTGGSIQTITTGTISATVDNTSVVLAIATGNNLLVIANQLNSGISGLLGSNLSSAAYVTGAVSLTNTAPLPVSGVTQANVTNALLAVSGLVSLTNALVAISGNTVNTVTGWNTGNIVTTVPRSSSVATNYGPSGVVPFTGVSAFFGQALAANVSRLECFVQNVHTGLPLYVNLGATAASTGNFSMILNPSTAIGWAGSSFGSDKYKGAIQVSGGAWVAWEL